MNHQPFKNWLLSEEPLTSEQTRSLQEHLRTCTICQQQQAAWPEVQALFKKAPQIGPAQGFTSRWQERLALERLSQQRRQAWSVFGLIAGLAAILLLLLGTQVFEILRSPSQLMLVWISRLTLLFSFLQEVGEFFNSLSRLIPAVPLTGLVLTTGVASLLSVLWMVAYQQLTTARRIAL